MAVNIGLRIFENRTPYRYGGKQALPRDCLLKLELTKELLAQTAEAIFCLDILLSPTGLTDEERYDKFITEWYKRVTSVNLPTKGTTC
jgi:hypothetical protein